MGVDGPSLGIAHEVTGITARHYAVEGYEPQVRHAMERVAAHLERLLREEPVA